MQKQTYQYDIKNESVKLEKQEVVKSEQPQQNEMQWSIQGIWNEELSMMKQSEPKVRDYITFGDLGKKDFWSRYQKMMGVPETNSFDVRVLRIFSAGDEFHHLLKMVFKKVGIFLNTQDVPDEFGRNQWSVIQNTPTMLKVLGKYDLLAGGIPNLEKATRAINESDLSDFVKDRSVKIAKYFAEKFADGLKPMLYEFKSINSMTFWNKKNFLANAYPHHILQLYGYLKANNLVEGRLLYISKDDLTLAEFPIYYPTEKYEQLLNEDIGQMSYYILNKQEPPKPDFIVFNPTKKFNFTKNKIKREVKGCWEVNWEVVRSSYFTLMTKQKESKPFEYSLKKELGIRNNLIKKKVLSII